ncbi:MAG: TetR/AcrR family transcriptional regulator [Cellvibrionaceae bacterium]|nr:TetR/AcrR family transcriptional regulator [Cellvibrionaceae bacterium]
MENDYQDAISVFQAFALYGYKKTSMISLAEALSMSRQGAYKRFKNKEFIFNWMLEKLLSQAMTEVDLVLADKGKALHGRVAEVFDIWSGRFIETLRSAPHAAEIVDRISANPSSNNELLNALVEALKATLIEEQLAPTEQECEDIAFTLYMASKGLTLTCENRRDFNEKMQKLISVILP